MPLPRWHSSISFLERSSSGPSGGYELHFRATKCLPRSIAHRGVCVALAVHGDLLCASRRLDSGSPVCPIGQNCWCLSRGWACVCHRQHSPTVAARSCISDPSFGAAMPDGADVASVAGRGLAEHPSFLEGGPDSHRYGLDGEFARALAPYFVHSECVGCNHCRSRGVEES